MGLTKVSLGIKSLDDPSKVVQEDFLVDSGAFYTVLPLWLVKKLGLKSKFEQEFFLADGTKVTRNMGDAFITFEGREIASPVVLGQKDDSALMGVLTLDAMGLILDPFSRKLHSAKLSL